MAIETELKLSIAPEQLARLKRHTLLKQHQVARPVTRRLYNIYYDTPKLELQKAAMALRLRRVGRQWLQTLKGGGVVKAGMHQRNEWEVPVSRAALDFSALQAAEWDEYLPLSLRKKLRPVFVTDFFRNSRMLEWQGAQIELCIDHGVVCTEQNSTPICELELELKAGEPRQLFELALALLEIVPFELETVSKAERGYRLLSGHVEKPVKAVVPEGAKTDALAIVLQKLLWSCMAHLQGNLHGAMTSNDAEYLHQVRVALRRLRVLLRMTEKLCADERLNGLIKEVAALCVELGQIREWDVFVDQTLRPVCARMPEHAGLQVVLEVSERQRNECYARLRGDALARELQRLILYFALWMNGQYWQQQGKIAPSARDFAEHHLRRLAKRFNRSVRHLDAADAVQLHALRIVVKKLKYSAEFFAMLYGKRKAHSYLAGLSEVQEVLGQINDVAVAHRMLEEFRQCRELATQHEAVALVKGWIAHELSRLFRALRHAVRHFDRQAAFWER